MLPARSRLFDCCKNFCKYSCNIVNVASQKCNQSTEAKSNHDLNHVIQKATRLQKIGNGMNEFTYRTHTCSELRGKDVGKQVKLCGWVEFQRMGKFVTIKDAYGSTQLLIPDDTKLENVTKKGLRKLNSESVIEVSGRVASRPSKEVNPKMTTGEIEVVVDHIKIVNEADKEKIPFLSRKYLTEHEREQDLLRYRYIHLRHPSMQHNLRLRSKLMLKMRNILSDLYGFVEVETPTLFKRTPGVCFF